MPSSNCYFNSAEIIPYDGILMLENGLYVGFEGPGCWIDWSLTAATSSLWQVSNSIHYIDDKIYERPSKPNDTGRNHKSQSIHGDANCTWGGFGG